MHIYIYRSLSVSLSLSLALSLSLSLCRSLPLNPGEVPGVAQRACQELEEAAKKTLEVRETLRLLLGGSWVGISGLISPLIWVISIVTLLIILLITTHEPPSRGLNRVPLY